MRLKPQEERVVYRHPRGRFEGIEKRGRNAFGGEYRIREAKLTPEKDDRGLLTEEIWEQYIDRRHIKKQFLTEEEKQTICRMYSEGKSISKIVSDMGRAFETVSKILQEAGLHEPKINEKPWTEQERKTLVRLWYCGHSHREIGAALGRTPKAVSVKLSEIRKKQAM